MDLQTERLRIRDWQPIEDAIEAFAIYGDERVMQWIGDRIPDSTLKATAARLQRYVQRTQSSQPVGTGTWAVVEQVGGSVIGNILLVPLPDQNRNPSGRIEIGWHFNPNYWGRGYATEAAQAILNYGFEALKLPEIYAVTLPTNHRSIAVMQRLSMIDLGVTTQYYGGTELRLFRSAANSLIG
ncbi:MAG TPA: GNAT family N-acetyltransferase [Leptolyngbyaceae cyanobacterium]